jgi:5-methylcytosine-specific restriction endonuclease McrA
MHKADGYTVVATVVDHIKAHRGDQELFWNKGNWQSLCKSCHDTHAQRRDQADLSGF